MCSYIDFFISTQMEFSRKETPSAESTDTEE